MQCAIMIIIRINIFSNCLSFDAIIFLAYLSAGKMNATSQNVVLMRIKAQSISLIKIKIATGNKNPAISVTIKIRHSFETLRLNLCLETQDGKNMSVL